jgi:hypothetical protein
MSSGNSTSLTGSVGSGSATKQSTFDPAAENEALSNYLLITCAVVSAALIIWRLGSEMVKRVRTIVSLHNDTQRYFAIPDSRFSFFKRNILYAPIFTKRHNREFQLGSAINVGTLPTRLQLLFLAGYFATNVAFCIIEIPFAGSYETAAKQLRNRTGSLAVVNMVRRKIISTL